MRREALVSFQIGLIIAFRETSGGFETKVDWQTSSRPKYNLPSTTTERKNIGLNTQQFYLT